MQLEAVGCLTLRDQEKMQMRKQRQRTGEQRSMRMVRRTCLNEKDVIKKQRGGFKYKKNKTIYFFFSYLKRYSNTYTFLQVVRVPTEVPLQ